VQKAALDAPRAVSEASAGALPEAEPATTPPSELADSEDSEPEAIEPEPGHVFLSEPVEPEDTAAIPAPEPVASATETAEHLAPAEAEDKIAALIEATANPVADAVPVKLARQAQPGTVAVFDAVDAKGASEEGSAEAAKAATLAQAPEPVPPLPLRKPVIEPAPEHPADTARHMVADAADVPEIEISQTAPTRTHWQPMSLGFAKDKPAAPTSRATSAPAPKPALSSGAYRSKVWSALARHRPRLGKPGSATVTFSIGTNGSLRGARLSRSSGNSALDARALSAVRSAAPFPAPPAGLSGSALTYAIQIYFR
jgi:protein TonB